MSSTHGGPATLCHLLDEDPDLAEGIPIALRPQATKDCVAITTRIQRGRWSTDRIDVGHTGIGLLVLDGLMTRSVGLEGRFGAELLGAGGLLRPWQGQDAPVPLTPQTRGESSSRHGSRCSTSRRPAAWPSTQR